MIPIETPRAARLLWWLLYALAAAAAALLATLAAPMWFSGPDGVDLLWADAADWADAWAPSVDRPWRPVADTLRLALYRGAGQNYWPWQLVQTLLWLAMPAAHYLAARAVLGRSRLALIAAALTPLIFLPRQGYALRLSQLGLQLSVILGLLAAAGAQIAWARRRRRWLWAPLATLAAAAALVSHELTVVWLPVLWIGAVFSRPVGRRKLWVAAGALLAPSLAAALLLWAPESFWTPGFAGALTTMDEFSSRLAADALRMRSGVSGAILAILAAAAGVSQAAKLPGRQWPTILVVGAAAAAVSLLIHPLLAMAALAGPMRRGWLWPATAAAAHLATAAMPEPGAAHLLPAMTAYAPGLLWPIARSPLGVWVVAHVRRARPRERSLITAAGAIAAVLALAHIHGYFRSYAWRLMDVSRARLAARDVTGIIVDTLEPGGAVAVVEPALTERLAPAEDWPIDRPRARPAPFTPAQYDAMLAAAGRADIRVAPLTAAGDQPGWLAIFREIEYDAAEAMLGPLGPPRARVPDRFAGLWRLGPAPPGDQ